jgi:hypothetical protein
VLAPLTTLLLAVVRQVALITQAAVVLVGLEQAPVNL